MASWDRGWEQRRPFPGWIYVLGLADRTDIVKVGMTTRNPTDRVRELTPDGFPTRLFVVHQRAVGDVEYVEAAAHKMLRAHQVRNMGLIMGHPFFDKATEFFKVSAPIAIQVVDAASRGSRKTWQNILPGRQRPRQRSAGRRYYARRRARTWGYLALAGLVAIIGVFRPPLTAHWLPAPFRIGGQIIEAAGAHLMHTTPAAR